jgi:hypothetical protein
MHWTQLQVAEDVSKLVETVQRSLADPQVPDDMAPWMHETPDLDWFPGVTALPKETREKLFLLASNVEDLLDATGAPR